jgi:hypothetical protein
MTKAAKALDRMKSNPPDWRFETLMSVAEANGLICRHANEAMWSVPARRPITAEGVSLNTLIVSLVSQGLGQRIEKVPQSGRPTKRKRSSGRAAKSAHRSALSPSAS